MSQIRNLMTMKSLLLPIVGAMLFLSGCAAPTKFGAAKINSNPQGAEVINLRDNSLLGTTPVNVTFAGEADSSELVTVQLRKVGYLDKITSFWVNKRHKTAVEGDDNAIDISVSLEKRANN
ncbi:hypothetical protein [Desulforhopalus sp. 52FAK]